MDDNIFSKDIKQFLDLPLLKIITIADSIRKNNCGNRLHLCSIINAKSGLCSGDCKYCAQSRFNKTNITTYPILDVEAIIKQACLREKLGAKHFSIVTSGESLNKKEIALVSEAIFKIKRTTRLKVCASLGMLSKRALLNLKDAGLDRYHHNIETSERYYREIVSTHKFEDRIKTIKLCKSLGIEVCSGGIVGMGESWDDRIAMAKTLKRLDVDSVALNVLIPIKGTAFESNPLMDPIDLLKTISLFRVILPTKEIRLIAGRELILQDLQLFAFLSGANGMMIGGYLTTKGDPWQRDKKLINYILKEWGEKDI